MRKLLPVLVFLGVLGCNGRFTKKGGDYCHNCCFDKVKVVVEQPEYKEQEKCVFTQTDVSLQIDCPGQELISVDLQGPAGKDGADGYIVNAFYICDDSGANHREIALETNKGQFIVYLQDSASSPNRRLTFLQEGFTYLTTDGFGEKCKFKIEDGEFIKLGVK